MKEVPQVSKSKENSQNEAQAGEVGETTDYKKQASVSTEAPPVPPPIPDTLISAMMAQTNPEVVADMPESELDRHEVIEEKQPVSAASGMVPLKEVLANHPKQPDLHTAGGAHMFQSVAKLPSGRKAMPESIRSLWASPVYRRAIASGASGGFVILLVLLFLQIR